MCLFRYDIETISGNPPPRVTSGKIPTTSAPFTPPSCHPPMPALPTAAGASPAMAQWFALKADHPDALLFFRMGDFYELFFADAESAAAALDIALTSRGEHAGAPIPMCGVPIHAAETYLARLIRRGFRVAVAEQMEDPKTRTSKAPIRRAVVRLITPGTLTEDALLDAARPNLLLAPGRGRPRPRRIGAAWLDVSTGLFETAALPAAELAGPARPSGTRRDPRPRHASPSPTGPTAVRPEAVPSPPLVARRRLAEAFGAASLDAFGSFTDAEAVAAALALDYVRATQAGALPRLARPAPQGRAGTAGDGRRHPRQPGNPAHPRRGTDSTRCSPPSTAP